MHQQTPRHMLACLCLCLMVGCCGCVQLLPPEEGLLDASRLLALENTPQAQPHTTEYEIREELGNDSTGRQCDNEAPLVPGLGVVGGIQQVCLAIGQGARARIAAHRYQHPRFHAVPLHPVFDPPSSKPPVAGFASTKVQDYTKLPLLEADNPERDPSFPPMLPEEIAPPVPKLQPLD